MLKSVFVAVAVSGMFILPRASAQITNTVFSEDFSSPIDPSRFVPDAPVFEGGKGDIAAQVHDGVVEFTGTVSEQWWAGATLRVVPTFPVSAETNVMFSVDRVSEAGVGTSSRSALWIMDATRTYYVLFADNTLENHWEYNRKIGVAGDVPTGGGTAIAAFNNASGPFLDEGPHQMKVLANGKTVRLYLDNVFGAQVSFPFNNLVFEIGSYARANGDTADTTFDNLKVETIGAEAFSTTALTLVSGQTINVTVRIAPGVNKTQAVQVRVTTSDPTVAIPVGAVGDTLTVTFPAGGSNEQTVGIKSVGPAGGAQLTLANDIGMASVNTLAVVAVEGAGVRLADDFASSTIDSTKWTNSSQGLEDGVGTFTTSQTGGQLVIGGLIDQSSYWGGASLNTIKAYTATPDLPLSFEMDRVSIDPITADGFTPSTGARTGVLMTTADRSQYIFFGQDMGETGWEVNVSTTGSGTAISQFASITDTNSHHMKLVADGTSVGVFLDGVSGGTYSFPVDSGIYFDVGAYARDLGDSVKGVFDNVKIQNIYPPVAVAPDGITSAISVNTNAVTVTIPRFLNANNAVAVTVTSQNPNVAVPAGAVNGALTLQFAAGAANVQSFLVNAVGVGTTTLSFTNDQAVATANGVAITVTSPPKTLFTDDFNTVLDTNANWTLDSTPLTVGGLLKPDSSVYITNNMVEMYVNADDVADWAGFALFTKKTYDASAISPINFEIDRVKMEFVQVGGNTTQERTGVWIKDSTTNYVYFGDFDTHDGTAGGWQYNAVIGASTDTPLPAGGKVIPAFGAASFNDLGSHHLTVVVNGIDAKLYVDGIFGAAAPFPFSKGITFGIGSYVNFANNFGSIVRGFYDNATIIGFPAAPPAVNITANTQQASGSDWDATGFWSDGKAASVSAAAGPLNTYELLPGARLRSPNNGTNATFPGKVLTVDGNGVFVLNPGATAPTSEIRFKNVDMGIVSFPNLIMNGGQLDTGNDGTVVIKGLITIAADSFFYNDNVNDRGYQIDALLAGTGMISFYQNATLNLTNYVHDLNITGNANTFSGKWNIVVGALLGSGQGSLGTNDITIGAQGALETLYDVNNPNGSLVLNGRMYLHQNDTFAQASINGSTLSKGQHTFGELAAAYPANFPSTWNAIIGSTVTNGSGGLTVLVGGFGGKFDSAALQGSNVVITWHGGGVLQSADAVTGTWTDQPTATSPLTVPTSSGSQKFYRLRQ